MATTPKSQPAPEPAAEVEPAEGTAAPVLHPTIIQALNAARAEVGAVRKDSKADPKLGGYQFRGVDAVVNATSGILAKHGVLVVPEVLAVERATTQSRQGASMLNVYVTTRFTFYGPAGDSVSATVLGEAADAGDKATAKAQSVALRVALLQTLLLPTDDVDPDAEGYQRAGRQEAAEHTAGAQRRGRPARDAQDAQEGSQEPREHPAHLRAFYDALGALTADQQAWVRANWPSPNPPDRMTVTQAAQAVEWMAANVPPPTGA